MFHCTLDVETLLPLDCTAAQMAHAQGEGCVRRSERRQLLVGYVRTGEGWAIDQIALKAL
jgi:hypothetical protein